MTHYDSVPAVTGIRHAIRSSVDSIKLTEHSAGNISVIAAHKPKTNHTLLDWLQYGTHQSRYMRVPRVQTVTVPVADIHIQATTGTSYGAVRDSIYPAALGD